MEDVTSRGYKAGGRGQHRGLGRMLADGQPFICAGTKRDVNQY